MMAVASTLHTRSVSGRDHVRGSASAAITLVQYGDYACPRCNQARAVVRRLETRVGDRLRYAFRNFPMSASHPFSHHAAEAAEAAGAQDKFWEMHNVLFNHQTALSDKHLRIYGTWGAAILRAYSPTLKRRPKPTADNQKERSWQAKINRAVQAHPTKNKIVLLNKAV